MRKAIRIIRKIVLAIITIGLGLNVVFPVIELVTKGVLEETVANTALASFGCICLIVLIDGMLDRAAKKQQQAAPTKRALLNIQPTSRLGSIIQTTTGIVLGLLALGFGLDGNNIQKLVLAPLGLLLATWIVYSSTEIRVRSRVHSNTEKIAKDKLQALESKSSWRLTKVIYFVFAILLFVIGVIAALSDEYSEHGTGYLAWAGILLIVIYPLFWRTIYYIYYGK